MPVLDFFRLIQRLFRTHLLKVVTLAAITAWYILKRRQRMLCRLGLRLVPNFVNQVSGNYNETDCGFTVAIETLNKPMWSYPEKHRDKKKYIFLSHETEYCFRINVLYDGSVVVKIDGHVVGCWLFEANKKYKVIKCGVKLNRQFTFLKFASDKGRMAGLSDNNSLGLVEFFYRPKIAVPTRTHSPDITRSYGTTRGLCAGGTGLGKTVRTVWKYNKKMDIDYDDKPLYIAVRLTCIDNLRDKPQYVHVSGGPPPRLA